MRLHEHEAASLFRQAGVPVAPFAVARTADEAVAALAKVELPVVNRLDPNRVWIPGEL